jgi:hypothetical protein
MIAVSLALEVIGGRCDAVGQILAETPTDARKFVVYRLDAAAAAIDVGHVTS